MSSCSHSSSRYPTTSRCRTSTHLYPDTKNGEKETGPLFWDKKGNFPSAISSNYLMKKEEQREGGWGQQWWKCTCLKKNEITTAPKIMIQTQQTTISFTTNHTTKIMYSPAQTSLTTLQPAPNIQCPKTFTSPSKRIVFSLTTSTAQQFWTFQPLQQGWFTSENAFKGNQTGGQTGC